MSFIQNPSITQQNAVMGKIKTGKEQDNFGQGGNLWASGLNVPQIETTLFYAFHDENQLGNYFLRAFFQFFSSRTIGVSQQDYGWYEMPRERNGAEVATLVTATGAQATITTTNVEEQFLVGDVLYSPINQVWMRVFGVSGGGTAETLVLERMDGNVFAAGDLNVGDILGFQNNVHAEGTGQPDSRTFKPNKKSNQLGIIKRTCESTGDAQTTSSRTSIAGGAAYVKTDEWITCKELFRDIENHLFNGSGQDLNGAKQTLGILPDIVTNTVNPGTYSGAFTEADLQTWSQAQTLVNSQSEYMHLAGNDQHHEFTSAMSAYVLNGGVNYGNFKAKGEALAYGLGLSQYRFADKLFNIKNYLPLSDEQVMGQANFGTTALSATNPNYKKFGLLLNLGNASGITGKQGETPLLSYMYKELNGHSRSLVLGKQKGMTGQYNDSLKNNSLVDMGAEVARSVMPTVESDVDADKLFMLSQNGVRLIHSDTHQSYIAQIS